MEARDVGNAPGGWIGSRTVDDFLSVCCKLFFSFLLFAGCCRRVREWFKLMIVKLPEHTELMWLLSCTASVGYLSRMTQWKVSKQAISKIFSFEI